MRRKRWATGGLGLASAIAGITASLAEDDGPGPAWERSGDECIFSRNVRDFDVIDNKNVILEGPGRSRIYLVTLFAPCSGIRFSSTMAVSGTSGRICGGHNDRIAFDSAFSMCYIDEIIRVESRDEARAIAEARAEENDNQH